MIAKQFSKIDLKKKLNNREKIIFALALAIFCFGFVKSCVVASSQAISEAQKKSEALEQERQQLLLQPKEVDREDDKNSKLGSYQDLKNASNAIMQPIHLKGVTILNGKFSAPEEEGSLAYRNVMLTLVGGYRAMLQYIEYLEHMSPAVIINNFSIKGDGSNIDLVVANINGVMYAPE